MAVFPPRDMVLAAPTFSRCLYAQLALQEYAPPRGYPMPLPSDPQVHQGFRELCGCGGGVTAGCCISCWQQDGLAHGFMLAPHKPTPLLHTHCAVQAG